MVAVVQDYHTALECSPYAPLENISSRYAASDPENDSSMVHWKIAFQHMLNPQSDDPLQDESTHISQDQLDVILERACSLDRQCKISGISRIDRGTSVRENQEAQSLFDSFDHLWIIKPGRGSKGEGKWIITVEEEYIVSILI